MMETEAKTDEKVSKQIEYKLLFLEVWQGERKGISPAHSQELMSQFSQHVYFCLEVMTYRLFHKVTDAFITGICNKSHVYRVIIALN